MTLYLLAISLLFLPFSQWWFDEASVDGDFHGQELPGDDGQQRLGDAFLSHGGGQLGHLAGVLDNWNRKKKN